MTVSTAVIKVIREEDLVAAVAVDITTTNKEVVVEVATLTKACTMSLSSSIVLVAPAVVELLTLRMLLRQMRQLDPRMRDDLERITVVEDVVVVETREDTILMQGRESLENCVVKKYSTLI